ncbi:MAG: DHHA1 domain-containing protein [Patescibacteria group bacterium]
MDNQKIKKNVVILYHADCSDGFGGAFAAWKKFGEEADYIPIEHQAPLPEDLKGKQIFFIDIVPDETILKKVINGNISVVGIDHHKTSEASMHLFKEYSFDNNHSGAVLAWKYFNQEKSVPKLLLLIEDMDLWRWGYPETSRFIAALALYDYGFDSWDKISSDIENPEKFKDYLSKGEIINTYIKRIANNLVKYAQKVNFEGYQVYAANVHHPIKSFVGPVLKEKYPPFAITWVQEGDIIHVSLRSDGSVDVSEIAKKYGGGGHKAAAGFSFPAGQPFPWKIIK